MMEKKKKKKSRTDTLSGYARKLALMAEIALHFNIN